MFSSARFLALIQACTCLGATPQARRKAAKVFSVGTFLVFLPGLTTPFSVLGLHPPTCLPSGVDQ